MSSRLPSKSWVLDAVAGDFKHIIVDAHCTSFVPGFVKRLIERLKLHSTVITGPGIDAVTVGIDDDSCAALGLFPAS